MTSEARILANRRNTQKRSGPKTAAGKAISRCNGLKHGRRSKILSMPVLPQKNPRDLECLVADFVRDGRPANIMERSLLVRAAKLTWMHGRSDRAESTHLAGAVRARSRSGKERGNSCMATRDPAELEITPEAETVAEPPDLSREASPLVPSPHRGGGLGRGGGMSEPSIEATLEDPGEPALLDAHSHDMGDRPLSLTLGCWKQADFGVVDEVFRWSDLLREPKPTRTNLSLSRSAGEGRGEGGRGLRTPAAQRCHRGQSDLGGPCEGRGDRRPSPHPSPAERERERNDRWAAQQDPREDPHRNSPYFQHPTLTLPHGGGRGPELTSPALGEEDSRDAEGPGLDSSALGEEESIELEPEPVPADLWEPAAIVIAEEAREPLPEDVRNPKLPVSAPGRKEDPLPQTQEEMREWLKTNSPARERSERSHELTAGEKEIQKFMDLLTLNLNTPVGRGLDYRKLPRRPKEEPAPCV